MTCCIGDLGLAVKESDFSEENDLPNYRQGTNRYLAPEILDGSIIKDDIYSYLMADVYSFSLVMWEVIRRSEWLGEGGRGGVCSLLISCYCSSVVIVVFEMLFDNLSVSCRR